jgi:hypothetical protein
VITSKFCLLQIGTGVVFGFVVVVGFGVVVFLVVVGFGVVVFLVVVGFGVVVFLVVVGFGVVVFLVVVGGVFACLLTRMFSTIYTHFSKPIF